MGLDRLGQKPISMQTQIDSLSWDKKVENLDRELVQKFSKQFQSKFGIRMQRFIAAIGKLSHKELLRTPHGTIEEIFKNIDLPFSDKIQAIRMYENFLKSRDSIINTRVREEQKKRMLEGVSREDVLKVGSEIREMNKSTVSLGLVLHEALELSRKMGLELGYPGEVKSK